MGPHAVLHASFCRYSRMPWVKPGGPFLSFLKSSKEEVFSGVLILCIVLFAEMLNAGCATYIIVGNIEIEVWFCLII